MHKTQSQQFMGPPTLFLVGEVIRKEGHSCMILFPCASGSGSPLMTVISGRKGKEGGAKRICFLFLLIFCDRRGRIAYFWKSPKVRSCY